MKPLQVWSPLSDAWLDLRRVYLIGKKIRIRENAREAINNDYVGSIFSALIVSGLIYFIISFPLLLFFGDLSIQSFFFFDLRESFIPSQHPIDNLNALIDSGNINTIFAALCLYGLLGIVVAVNTGLKLTPLV